MISEFCAKLILLLVLACTVIFAAGIAGASLGEDNNGTNKNTTSPDSPVDPFITIDPIGNHTVGEVFFINGTTNLPASEKLIMNIVDFYWFERPKSKSEPDHPAFGKYAYNIQVTPMGTVSPGTNQWSVNITDIAKKLDSAEYFVEVYPQRNPCYIPGCLRLKGDYSQTFMLLPAKNGTLTTDFPTPIPSPSLIQQKEDTIVSTTCSGIKYQTERNTSLPLILPLIVLVIVVIFKSLRGKKVIK